MILSSRSWDIFSSLSWFQLFCLNSGPTLLSMSLLCSVSSIKLLPTFGTSFYPINWEQPMVHFNSPCNSLFCKVLLLICQFSLQSNCLGDTDVHTCAHMIVYDLRIWPQMQDCFRVTLSECVIHWKVESSPLFCQRKSKQWSRCMPFFCTGTYIAQ